MHLSQSDNKSYCGGRMVLGLSGEMSIALELESYWVCCGYGAVELYRSHKTFLEHHFILITRQFDLIPNAVLTVSPAMPHAYTNYNIF